MNGKAMLLMWGDHIDEANASIGQESLGNSQVILQIARVGHIIPGTAPGDLTEPERAADHRNSKVFVIDAVIHDWNPIWRDLATLKFRHSSRPTNHRIAKLWDWDVNMVSCNLRTMYMALERSVNNESPYDVYVKDKVLVAALRRALA